MAKSPKQRIDDKIWAARIPSANKYYEKWEKMFQCDVLESYYEGFQWQDPDPDSPQYTINKIYETLQIKLDSFMSEFFKYIVKPRPANSDYDIEMASRSAQLKEDVLNSVVSDNSLHFSEEIKDAYKDSYFRFGVVEVGYEADWIINPNIPKPALNTDSEEFPNRDRVKIKNQPIEVPANERIYWKQIPAKNFRVGGIDHKYLSRCTWYGYKELVHKSDVLAIPGLMNRDKVENHIGMAEPSSTTTDMASNQESGNGEAIWIWHLWDNKERVRLIVLDGSFTTIFQRTFVRQTIFDYRHDTRVSAPGFYPIPPVFHWLSPQRELNEVREQLRNHRKRFVRKYQMMKGSIDEEEIDKFETGGDGTIVITNRDNALQPVLDAPLGVVPDKMLAVSDDDLNKISGTPLLQRGASARTTATESTLIDAKATLRENAEKMRITKWLSKIGRETLLTIQEKFVFDLYVELTSDSKESLFAEVQEQQAVYKAVSTEDLSDGYDFRVDVDVTSLSIASREQEKQIFIEFLAVTSQFPAIMLSPILIREAAYRIGYRNERVIKEMQNAALLAQAGAMAGIGGLQGGNAAQTTTQQMTPPDAEQIRNQLAGQGTGVQ